MDWKGAMGTMTTTNTALNSLSFRFTPCHVYRGKCLVVFFSEVVCFVLSFLFIDVTKNSKVPSQFNVYH